MQVYKNKPGGCIEVFIGEEDKKIYRFLRGLEGTSEILTGNFLCGLWSYIKYTVLLWL